MGLFDSVMVDCPHCGSKVELQCEGNEAMSIYTLETAPDFILRQVMDGIPSHCEKCDGWLVIVDPRTPLKPPERPPTEVRKVRKPDNPSTHEQGMKWWPNDDPITVDDLINE